jgi:hypothetical protein
MTPTEYEKTVRDLAELLHGSFGDGEIQRLTWGKSSIVVGLSGQPHQIDVVLEDKSNVLLVECKLWSHKVDLPTFLTHVGRLSDVAGTFDYKNVVGVVATSVGFDPGPETVAQHRAIELWHVTSPQEFVLRYRQHRHIGLVEHAKIPTPVVTVMKYDDNGNLLETVSSADGG